ncbi:IS630 family transposase, partial [Moorena sp. SIO3H5]|uniref:IS630 family transposase n=1 Tax=Moorena sp. SIO3H5 TaxID=2607834 RepID=UPI0013B7F1C5
VIYVNDHADTIEAYFKEHPPRTVADAQSKIEQLTGFKRSPTQIKAFLKHIGMKCRKVGFIPGKGSDPDKIEEQEQFRQHQLEPLLAEAKAGTRAVFFVDAAHFVHRAYLGFVWCFTRIFIPSPSGRKRFNVLGAINAVTKEVVTITNESYINAGSVVDLLVALADLGLEIPITIVLDNARYQKCPFVKDVAYFLGIELLYLPSYSPHLNLIERLWKFVRNDCLYSTYYEDFESFKAAISGCLEKANTDHKAKLESLLSWNFQSFKKVQLLAV